MNLKFEEAKSAVHWRVQVVIPRLGSQAKVFQKGTRHSSELGPWDYLIPDLILRVLQLPELLQLVHPLEHQHRLHLVHLAQILRARRICQPTHWLKNENLKAKISF